MARGRRGRQQRRVRGVRNGFRPQQREPSVPVPAPHGAAAGEIPAKLPHGAETAVPAKRKGRLTIITNCPLSDADDARQGGVFLFRSRFLRFRSRGVDFIERKGTMETNGGMRERNNL